MRLSLTPASLLLAALFVLTQSAELSTVPQLPPPDNLPDLGKRAPAYGTELRYVARIEPYTTTGNDLALTLWFKTTQGDFAGAVFVAGDEDVPLMPWLLERKFVLVTVQDAYTTTP